MYSTKCFVFLATIGIALGQNTSSPDSSIRVLDSGGNATSPLQYGIMFEVRKLKHVHKDNTDVL